MTGWLSNKQKRTIENITRQSEFVIRQKKQHVYGKHG